MKAYSSPILLALFLSCGIASAQVTTPEVPDYIRFRSSPDKSRPDFLETAVSRFQRGNHTIDLIAVVHLGDAEYYRMLNFSLKPYDAVFYEMVGGPFSKEKALQSKQAKSKDGDLAQVQTLQQMAKGILGLEFQLDGVDYLAPNFVHADMTSEEFSRHSGGGQDLTNMLARAMKIAQSGQFKGMPSSEEEANQMMMMLFGAVMSGNSNELKRTLAPILSEAEAFISQLEEEEGSVLISERNKIVIDKINATLAANRGQRRTDAVLYGAGHMPDLEARLKRMGYRKVSTHWSQSWKIDHGIANNTVGPNNLQDLTNQIGDLLRSLEGR